MVLEKVNDAAKRLTKMYKNSPFSPTWKCWNTSESRPAAGEFQHFHVRKIHFRQPFTGISVIRVFIIEYVGEEISKIIKFGNFLRFSGPNSAKKRRRSDPKCGKDASRWDLSFVGQKFYSTMRIFRVIYEIPAKNRKKRKNGRGCQLWPQISRLTEFSRTSGLWQQTRNIV